jgi:N-acetylmuramoyl-L-alanine amidase
MNVVSGAIVACFLTLVAAQDQLPDVCNTYTFYGRSKWGWVPVLEGLVPSNLPFPKVIIYDRKGECSTADGCKALVKEFQQKDIENGLIDIAENLLISPAGDVFSARSWDFVGAHTKGYNDIAVGIAIIGDYSSNAPPGAALATLDKLIECGSLIGKVKVNYSRYAQRDLLCSSKKPGDAFYAKIKTMLNYGGSLCRK